MGVSNGFGSFTVPSNGSSTGVEDMGQFNALNNCINVSAANGITTATNGRLLNNNLPFVAVVMPFAALTLIQLFSALNCPMSSTPVDDPLLGTVNEPKPLLTPMGYACFKEVPDQVEI